MGAVEAIGVPTGLLVTGFSSTEIDLSWTNSPADVSEIDIYLSTDGVNYSEFDSVSPGMTTYAATGLDSGTNYWFEVVANVNGPQSTPSNSAAQETAGIPAPEDLTVAVVSPIEVDLAWDDPAGLATPFEVQRSSDGGTTWQTLSTDVAASSSDSFADTTAGDGMDYLYQVIGSDASDSSIPSATAEAVTPLRAARSFTPTAAADGGAVTLTWSETSSDTTGDIQFEVDRSDDGGSTWNTLTVTDAWDTSNTYTDDTVLGLTAYQYRIQALNAVSESGYITASVTTPLAVPATPIDLTATAASPTSVTVNWSADTTDPGGTASGFTLSISSDEGQTYTAIYTGSATTFSDTTGISPASTYLFQVTANNSAGPSDPQGPVGVQTPAFVASPPALSATDITQTSATLNWTDTNINEDGVEVWMQGPNDGSQFTQVPVTPGLLTQTETGLTPGTSYLFIVRSMKADTYVVFSNAIRVTTESSDSTEAGSWVTVTLDASAITVQSSTNSPPTNTPYNLTAWPDASGTGVDLAWDNNEGTGTGFELQRSVDGVNFTTLANLSGSADSYVDASALQDSYYVYRLYSTIDTFSDGTLTSSGYATADVNTLGVRISFPDAGLDPAGNPEIWLDSSAMNYSSENFSPPVAGDPNLVSVLATVPLGEDDYGTATLIWSSSIRLYCSSFEQVGNLANGLYSYTWSVAPGDVSQSFLAQAISPSTQPGDRTFSLTACLTLLSTATVDAEPTLPQADTSPATTRPASAPEMYITTNREGSLDAKGNLYAMAGQKISAWMTAGPNAIIPNTTKFEWDVADAIHAYTTTLTKAEVVSLPFGPADLGQTSGSSMVHWYWITGTVDGSESYSIQAIGDGLKRTLGIDVYVPSVSFDSVATANVPMVQLGTTFILPNSETYHYGASNRMVDGKATPFSPGEGYQGQIVTPNLADANGTVAFMQQINASFTATKTNGQTYNLSTGGYVLDTAYPAMTTLAPANRQTNIGIRDWNDSPDVELDKNLFNQFSYLFTAIPYIIYKPAGGDSIYVTLLASSWQWGQTFDRSAKDQSHWHVSASNPSEKIAFDPFTELPVWTDNYSTFQGKMLKMGK